MRRGVAGDRGIGGCGLLDDRRRHGAALQPQRRRRARRRERLQPARLARRADVGAAWLRLRAGAAAEPAVPAHARARRRIDGRGARCRRCRLGSDRHFCADVPAAASSPARQYRRARPQLPRDADARAPRRRRCPRRSPSPEARRSSASQWPRGLRLRVARRPHARRRGSSRPATATARRSGPTRASRAARSRSSASAFRCPAVRRLSGPVVHSFNLARSLSIA